MAQGLAPSTRKAYASGQRKFIEFCRQAGKLPSNGSPCPADEWTLCLFVSFLADSIQHSSIKVYLSAVHSLHIEQGFPDPLLNSLRLKRVLRVFKRTQGSPAARHLPITDSLLLVIHRALDLKFFIIAPFGQPACWVLLVSLCYRISVPNLASFSPAIHLSVADISVDLLQSPACLSVRIKALRRIHSVRVATSILVCEGHPSAQFRLCWLTSPSEEMSLVPCSYLRMVNLSLAQS